MTLYLRKPYLWRSCVSRLMQVLMHSPEVATWLQTHQSKRRQRRLQLPLRCRARHRGSTDSHDSSQPMTVSGAEDTATYDVKSVGSDSAVLRVAPDNCCSQYLAAPSTCSPVALNKEDLAVVQQSTVSCPLAPVIDVGLFGVADGAATAALRLSDVCGSGIWSKADSAFVSVIGAKSSKSSAWWNWMLRDLILWIVICDCFVFINPNQRCK